MRKLFAEAIDYVRRLLDSSDEAHRYEDSRERSGTNLTVDGTGATISCCLECGATPLCDASTDRLARVTGYNTPARTLRGGQ